MRRWREWWQRHDARTDTQKAVVAVLLTWFGGALGLMVAIVSAVTHDMVGVLEGLALVGLAVSVDIRS